MSQEISLYDKLVEEGVEISSWQSDLYFPINDLTLKILQRYPLECSLAKTFLSKTNGKMMYEVPFAYLPYWRNLNENL